MRTESTILVQPGGLHCSITHVLLPFDKIPRKCNSEAIKCKGWYTDQNKEKQNKTKKQSKKVVLKSPTFWLNKEIRYSVN